MSNGTGPPPALGSHPNGIDITDPKYAFNTEDWIETPRQFPEAFINGTTMTLRKENDSAYQQVGNPSTWERYITFGYHAYDHCFQFETQWERMKMNENDALTFIWKVYSYHLNRALDMPMKLERWAIDIARPYLLNNTPSALTPDTSDPRNARMRYDEPECMDHDDEMDSKPPARDWSLVGRKHKLKPHKVATQTPLPSSPTRPTDEPPLTQPPTTQGPPSGPGQRNNHIHEDNFVHMNDGTLRITVKWKPENYDDLIDDQDKWNYEATDLIHYLLSTATDAVIYPWKTAPGAAIAIPFIDLTPDNLPDYLGTRTLPLRSPKMFVFSFRLCLTTGPSKWLKHPNTKRNLDHHHAELSISNASSDSGEPTPVGYIFFKHPTLTQRFFYLKELRRKLPPTTPFFDLALIRKTPTGRTVPHLVVKCGENHAGALTEILSAHLNGTETSVFLGRLMISKMATDEVDALFQTHADFVTSIRCLSLSPLVQNIDRVRTEYRKEGNHLSTARIWAKTLVDEDGNSLQCDVENGGNNQRAQLLVPVKHLNKAQTALKEYKEAISPFNLRENSFTERINQAHPEEIYVPTAVAHHNLDLIKGLSPTTTWENAPASIRQPPGTSPLLPYRPPNTAKPSHDQHPSTSQHAQPHFPDLSPRFKNKNDTQHLEPTQQSLSDTNTTSSLMTKSLATQQRFQDLENYIRQQNTEIRSHQTEFKKVNTRFDGLEERVFTAMTFCKDTSQNVLELRKETNENILGMRQEAATQAQEFRIAFEHVTRLISALATHTAPDSDSENSAGSTKSDSMSVQSLDTTKQGTSPRKKKGKRTIHQSELDSIRKHPDPKHDQDPSAQYNSDSTPDAGDT